jgi:hypothetical protein
METTISTVAEAAAWVISEIRRDIADERYEGADLLDSFCLLHDYLDANDYLISAAEQFCAYPNDSDSEDIHVLWQDWTDAVADAVDTLLHEQPITV